MNINSLDGLGQQRQQLSGGSLNGLGQQLSGGSLGSSVSGSAGYPYAPLQQAVFSTPLRTAAENFLKIQYAESELRCAITRKMIPAGSPIMLLGGMVISQEAFESWLEEHLSGLLCRHQDVHTDTSGYDE